MLIVLSSCSNEGAVMRRQDGGAGRGARGRRQTQPSAPGQGRTPPGTLGCPARSWLTAWTQGSPGRKRGPDPVKRRDGAPKGARVLQKRTRQDEYGRALSALHPLAFARGEKRLRESGAGTTAYPGPVKNTGDFTRLVCAACPTLVL